MSKAVLHLSYVFAGKPMEQGNVGSQKISVCREMLFPERIEWLEILLQYLCRDDERLGCLQLLRNLFTDGRILARNYFWPARRIGILSMRSNISFSFKTSSLLSFSPPSFPMRTAVKSNPAMPASARSA